MATPSSSATTPSPQLRYLQPHTPVAAPEPTSNGIMPNDKEERDNAVQKFMARAEIAKLTRNLRTRLSYATYKATNNVPNSTLRDLENDALNHPRSRQGNNNYYNNPATQGNSAMVTGGSGRANTRKGSMAPPPPVTASATQSLFSSILAPPPTKRARTIHNPEDPPVPAPVMSKPQNPSPSPRKAAKAARPDGSQPKTRARKSSTRDKDGKARGRQHATRDSGDSTAGVDIDMKAAATLTSMLLSSRPSISASASSPRSSISAGSDAGSTHSFPHYTQSSARTLPAATSTPGPSTAYGARRERPGTPPSTSSIESLESDMRETLSQASSLRTEGRSTPRVRKRSAYRAEGSGTPHPPSDTEAASSLLFLATSPSPVRPSHPRDRDAKDSVAFRALSGSSSLKGRVLFPGVSGADENRTRSRTLRRDDSGSFASTISTSSEFAPGGSFPHIYNNHAPPGAAALTLGQREPPNTSHAQVLMATVTPPTPTELASTHSSLLLPAPPSPVRTERFVSSRSNSAERPQEPVPMTGLQSEAKKLGEAPPTPGNGSFNLSDFINVSPSPAGAVGSVSRLGSMHADIGRRLFDDHQGANGAGSLSAGAQSGSHAGDLDVGINLMQS